jgi:hypothetical protein
MKAKVKRAVSQPEPFLCDRVQKAKLLRLSLEGLSNTSDGSCLTPGDFAPVIALALDIEGELVQHETVCRHQ